VERSTCRLRKQGVDYESNERIIMIANASSARAARCKGASVVGGRRVLRAVAALPPKASAETAPIEEVTGRRAAALSVSAAFGATLASFGVFGASAPRALALLPDDDDEELIRKARAKRQTALKEELAKEKAFAIKKGYSKATKEEIDAVQLAVAKLVKTATLIDQGDYGTATGVIGDASTPWAVDLAQFAEKTSEGSAAEPATKMMASLRDLQASVKSKDGDAALESYVSTSSAFLDWCSAIGLSKSVKGLYAP